MAQDVGRGGATRDRYRFIAGALASMVVLSSCLTVTVDRTAEPTVPDSTLEPTPPTAGPTQPDQPPSTVLTTTEPSPADVGTTDVPLTTTESSAPPTTAPGSGDAQFFAGFDHDERDRFDWRLQTTNEPPQRTFLGEHDMGCEGPHTYRDVDQVPLEWGVAHTNVDATHSEQVWWCAPGNDTAKGHMMTGVDTDSIASLSFSPKEAFTDVTRVCWDQNMNNLGEGKWLNVFIVPAADVDAHDGDLAYLAGSGLSFGGIPHLLPPGAVDFTWLRGSIGSHKVQPDGSYRQDFDVWMSIDPTDTNGNGTIDPDDAPTQGMATSSAPRFTICIDDGADRVTIERPNGAVDTYAYPIAFPTGRVRVIFQDASYSPTKHEGSEQHLTWHWDNITIT